MAKEANKFYESERKNIVISHSDLSHDQEMDYVSEIEMLNDYLLERKDWESLLVSGSKRQNDIDTRVANDIFTICHQKFPEIDTVQLFDTITSFYNFDSKEYFERLGHKYRQKLLYDLTTRMGQINISNDTIIDKGKVQKSFVDVLSKFKSK